MSWETKPGRRRCYTQTRKRNGRVVRIYVGSGEKAEEIAAEDSRQHAERLARWAAQRGERQRWRTAEEPLASLAEIADSLLGLHLLAGGFYQHDRGEWRRRKHVPDINPPTD